MKRTPLGISKHTQAACLHVTQDPQKCNSRRTDTSCCNKTLGTFCHACGMKAPSAEQYDMTLVCRKAATATCVSMRPWPWDHALPLLRVLLRVWAVPKLRACQAV